MLSKQLIQSLKQATSCNPFWRHYLKELELTRKSRFAVHLAIFSEPYLGFVLDGSKAIESRFAKHRIAPYGSVSSGDVVLIKKAAANMLSGMFLVGDVWFYELDVDTWREIRKEFGNALRADDSSFWEVRKSARYSTLMEVCEMHALPPIEIRKRDRRGWVVLQRRQIGTCEITGIGAA